MGQASNDIPPLKVALVRDWITDIGGAERVVLELHKLYPEAPIYTSQYDPKKINWFTDADVRTGWLQKLPVRLKKFLPVLRAWYFSRLDLSEYDLVISETGSEAKAIKFGPQTTHLCICNTPTHYYWSRYETYLKDPGLPTGLNWLAKLGLRTLIGPLRRWDYKAAQKPTQIIAISSHIKQQIKHYYDRDSTVIFPPVDTTRFSQKKTTTPREGFVITGRQTPYKQIGLAVAACSELNLPLKVIGNGPEHEKLVTMAGPTIQFITDATDEDVAKHLRCASGFIFPGLDDFGISPVEALAAGTPVIAYKAGGALDYVIPGKTGEFFTKQSADSLIQTLRRFDGKNYQPEVLIHQAERFSNQQFAKQIRRFVSTTMSSE